MVVLPGSGSISSICVPSRAGFCRRIDEAHLQPLIGHVERLMNFGRAHHIAVKYDAVRDGGRCDADVVESA